MPNTPNYMRYPIAPIMPKQQQLSPVSAFMLSLQQSLVPILQYKMQQQMQNDAYTKKFEMEKLYEERKAAKELEAKKSDPEWQMKQAEAQTWLGLPEADRQRAARIKMGIEAKPEAPKPETPRDKLFNMLYPQLHKSLEGGGGGSAATNPLLRGITASEFGVSPTAIESLFPKNEEELTLDSARNELSLVQKDTEKATLESAALERDREREIALQMRARGVDRVAATKLVDEQAAGIKPEDNKISNKFDLFMAAQKNGPDSPEAKQLAAFQDLEKKDPDIAQLPPHVASRLGEIAARGIPLPTAPSFGMGQAGMPARIQFWTDFIKTVDNQGSDGVGDYALNRAGQKSDTSSLQVQQKTRDAMQSFVKNMDKQVVRLSKIVNDVSRTDARLLNVPIRSLAMKAKGSAAEAKVNMYLTEISNEIGKLSTGSSASIAELSQTAQEKWDKIHDPNLSIADLLSLLEETRHAGRLRIESADETIGEIRGRIGGKGSKKPAWFEKKQPASTPNKVGRFTIEVE